MKLFFCAGKTYRSNDSMLGYAAELFASAGCELFALKSTRELFGEKDCLTFVDSENDIDFDALLSIGGDGTLLHNAQYALEYDKPILGANAGSLGFLCAFDLKKAAEKITADSIDNLKTSERMILSTSCSETSDIYNAVNDAVVMRAPISKVVELSIFKNGSFLTKYKADGVIVSTPTGSTAYSFSAGGPVIDPQMDVILITPICAHSSMNRSILLSADDVIRIEVSERSSNDAYFSSDSFDSVHLFPGSSITIRKSNMRLKLLISDYEKYIEALNNKFTEGL